MHNGSPHERPPDPYRKYFLTAGLVLGCILSGLYLLALRNQAISNPHVTPDPWFKRAFFIVLIFFASFFQCSLLSKLFTLLMKRVNRPRS